MVLVNEPAGVANGHRRIADLMQELHGRTDADAVLAELVEHAAIEIPAAEYAGVTVTRDKRQIDTPAATDKWPILLDEIQQRHGEGPCLTAAWEQQTVYVADLRCDERFPHYRKEALESTPIRSIMAFQLFVADRTMGALNVYAEQPDAFGPDSRELGLIFAAHSSVAWNSVRRDEQFRSALASRDVIGQAKGRIMERYDVDAVQAFDMLRKLSQDSNVPLIRVATELATGVRPDV